jgi:UDP-N-acetylglucosamine acyltransferase
MSVAVHPAAHVDPRARLGAGVTVGPGAVIGPDAELGDGCEVAAHALVTGWTRVGRGCRIHHGAVVGAEPQDLKYRGEPTRVEVGDGTVLREYSTVHRATAPQGTTRVGRECLIMAYAHVAHDCVVGDHCILANAVNLAGFVTVEDYAIVGGVTPVHQFVRIGAHSIIGGGSRVPLDVAPYVKAAGNPLHNYGLNLVGLERRGFSPEVRAALKQAYRLLFREDLPLGEAVERIRRECGGSPEVEHFARFAETSVRGLTR